DLPEVGVGTVPARIVLDELRRGARALELVLAARQPRAVEQLVGLAIARRLSGHLAVRTAGSAAEHRVELPRSAPGPRVAGQPVVARLVVIELEHELLVVRVGERVERLRPSRWVRARGSRLGCRGTMAAAGFDDVVVEGEVVVVVLPILG